MVDMDYVKWSVENCLYECQVAIDDLLNNFPIRWLGKVFRSIIFPWGTAYQKPNDDLSHRIVTTMLEPSEFRDRLTQYCFIAQDSDDPMRRLENTLAKVKLIDPIWKKFQVAIRQGKIPRWIAVKEQLNTAATLQILTKDEVTALTEFNYLYQEVIKVNEFSFDLGTLVT
jgi:acyl-CoA dehydrogenase